MHAFGIKSLKNAQVDTDEWTWELERTHPPRDLAMLMEEGPNVTNMSQLMLFSQFDFNMNYIKNYLFIFFINHQRKDVAEMTHSQQKIIFLIKTFRGNNWIVTTEEAAAFHWNSAKGFQGYIGENIISWFLHR